MPAPAILTPPVISKLPLGLLAFLGIKSGGSYPQSLSPTLVTVFDQLGLLNTNHGEDVTLATTAAAPGFTILATVPESQVWCVQYYSGSVLTQAAEAWAGSLCIQHIRPATDFLQQFQGANIGATALAVMAAPPFTWVGPGDILDLRTSSITGTVDVYLSARITRWAI
jgi:hypothetical protein